MKNLDNYCIRMAVFVLLFVILGFNRSFGQSCCDYGPPALLWVEYTGEDCSATVTSQPPSFWSCSGDPAMDPEVFIIANDKANPALGIIWFSGTVELNEIFLLDALALGENKLKSNTYFHIYAYEGGPLLQTAHFHSSCSEDFALADQIGSMEFIAAVDHQDVAACGTVPAITGDCFAKAGTAYEVGGDLSGTESEVEGPSDEIGVQIYDADDLVQFQMEGQIPAGSDYTLRVRRRPGDNNSALPLIYESTDAMNFFLHPGSGVVQINTSALWLDITLEAQIDVNFIQIGKHSTSLSGFELDAVISSSCEDHTGLLPYGWEFDCDDNVSVDYVATGANNGVPVTHVIPDPSSVFEVWVEVLYYADNPGPNISITDQDGTSYLADLAIPPGTDGNAFYYLATLPAGTSLVQYANASGQGQVQSMITHIFRNGSINNSSSSGIFISRSLFNEFSTFIVDIPTYIEARDVTVRVPITELSNDGSVVTVMASAGGVSDSQTINGPDGSVGSCCLNMVELFLPDVPGTETTVTITVEALPIGGTPAQSVVISGFVEASTNCGCNPLTDPGNIAGDEEGCGAYDPSIIISTEAATGGNGGLIIYQWESSTDGGNNWYEIPGANAPSFNPPLIAQTTQYRRKTRRSDCPDFLISNIVTKTSMINYSGGGTIGDSETRCYAFDPPLLVNVISPSGGFGGSPEYQWQSRLIGGAWTDIPGANGIEYDPPFITESMQYRRRSRLAPCTDWRNSNVVQKIVICPPIAIDDINNTLIDVPVTGNVLTNDSDPNNDNLTVNAVNGVLLGPGGTTVLTINGTLTIFPDGSYTYTPNAGFTGEDILTYEVCDDGSQTSLCSSASITITVIDPGDPVNNPPVANNDAVQTELGTPVVIEVLANDYDPDGDVIGTALQLTNPQNGTVVQNPDGTFTYTPDAGFSGEDSFSYAACDPSGLCDQAFVFIVITEENEQTNNPPVAVDDAYYTQFDIAISGNASLNDFDPDGDSPLSFSVISMPLNGSLVFSPDGSFTYTPIPGYTGPDHFIYEVCDGISGCDQATVYLLVGPRNNPPVAIDDINNTIVDVPVTGNILTNDFDQDGDNIFLISVNGQSLGPTITAFSTANGSVSIFPNGSYTYVPAPGFTGEDSFSYEICDNGNPGPYCSTANVTIEVVAIFDPVNNPPVANNDAAFTEENTGVPIPVLSNDYDPDGDVLGFPIVTSLPSNGFIFQNPDGSFTYFPNPGFVGSDSFNYSVCDPFFVCDEATVVIVVISDNDEVNDPPLAIDDAFLTEVDTPLSGDASLNDSDPDADSPLVYTLISSPLNGGVIFNGDGTFVYTPSPGYFGPDNFSYEVCDGISGCDQATVYIVIPLRNTPPVAIGDFNNTLQGVYVEGNVLTNDYDPDGDNIDVTGFSLSLSGTGPYSNSITLFGQGTITLLDPVSGLYSFDPEPSFLGSTNPVSYQICDPIGECATAILVIEVMPSDNPGNDPPIANDDHFQTPFETPVNADIIANDVDQDGDQLTLTGGEVSGLSANGGTWILTNSGMVTYNPPLGFSGYDFLFEYQVCDDSGLCDQAGVYVFVGEESEESNSPPSANDDAYVTNFNQVIQGSNILDNDPVDPDGDPVTLTSVQGVPLGAGGMTVSTQNGGTLQITSGGMFTYTSPAGYSGPDRFIYEVCDGVSGCDQATAYITILPEICVGVELFLFLEGAYISGQNAMRTDLNTVRSILPGQTPVNPLVSPTVAGNPYRGIPFYYDGTIEEENYAGPYINNSGLAVTDWVLVSFRTSPSKTDEFIQANGLLYEDGHVEFIKPCILRVTDPSDVWVVVEHRNHLGIMSATAVSRIDGVLTYDFREADSYNTPTSFGQKQIEPGVFGMYAGDADQAVDFPGYDINGLDNILWTQENGNFDQYLRSDFDLNGDSNGADIIKWANNNGISSAVPKN